MKKQYRYRVAVIGAGQWGKKIISSLEKLPQAVLVYVENRDYRKLVSKNDIDAVIISTPGSTHKEIALPFVRRGLPVFIEKPMTTRLADGLLLEKEAKKSGSLIFVGHIHIYNPAYIKIKELIKKIGPIRWIYGEGANNGPYRSDISAMWDWAPHDIAMFLDIVGSRPISVQAWSASYLRPGTKISDIAFIKLNFPKGVTGFIFNSWLFPEKRKRVTIVGEKSSVVFDDTAEKKVAFYENMGPKLIKRKNVIGVIKQESPAVYREYDKESPLISELKAFFKDIGLKRKPKTSIPEGIEVVKILEAAEKSVNAGGKSIDVKWEK